MPSRSVAGGVDAADADADADVGVGDGDDGDCHEDSVDRSRHSPTGCSANQPVNWIGIQSCSRVCD